MQGPRAADSKKRLSLGMKRWDGVTLPEPEGREG